MSVTKLRAVVRVVQRLGNSRAASGLVYEVGKVRLKGQSVLVYRGNGLASWATASPGQFPAMAPRLEAGQLVRFKSEYQRGTATIDKIEGGQVWLRGVNVVSKWGQAMVEGNSIVVERGQIL
jgi:hypothetical protein